MGLVGWALALISMYFIGRKVWWGFLLGILANVFIGWNAWETRNPSLGTAVVVFVSMHLFNIVRWRKNPPEPAVGYDRSEIVFMAASIFLLFMSWKLFG